MGLALPGSALLPATSPDLEDYAYRAGKQAVALALQGIKPGDIVTMDSLENAILVHAAISGSTNCLLHLPAIAHEYGIAIDGDTFDRLHRGAKYLLDLRPAGRWPAEFFYYAGGVPAIMEEIRDRLHLDAMTVTGKTLGENLAELKAGGFYDRCQGWLDKANQKYGIHITKEDIIRPADRAIGSDGSIAILKGNLAPEGAVIKHTACPKEMFHAVLRARPFDSEEDCLDAVLHHKVQKGDAVFIRYEGPQGSGMPEMFYTSEAISSDAELGRAIALITDGRFSGASTAPVIGHCSPEAQAGGPIALVEEGDLIEIDVENRVLAIVGIAGERRTPEEIDTVLARRRENWRPKPRRYQRGTLRLFAEHAASPMKGAYLAWWPATWTVRCCPHRTPAWSPACWTGSAPAGGPAGCSARPAAAAIPRCALCLRMWCRMWYSWPKMARWPIRTTACCTALPCRGNCAASWWPTSTPCRNARPG